MIYMFRNMSKKGDLFKLEYLKAVFNDIIKSVSVMRGPEQEKPFCPIFLFLTLVKDHYTGRRL